MSTPFRVKHGLIAGITSENTSPISASNQVLTGSSSTALVDLATQWNTTGTPTAFKLNVTDTASNASSLLMDLQVGGSSRFNVRKDGDLSARVGTFSEEIIVKNQTINQKALAVSLVFGGI